MFKNTLLSLCVAVAAAAVVSACTNIGGLEMLANPFATKVPFIVPAASSAAATLRAVSVVPLASVDSQLLARAVESDMLKLKFQEETYYKKVVLEDPLAANVAGASQLQAIANRSGTTGVVTIRSLKGEVTRRAYQETRFDCSKKTNLFQLCPKDAQQTRQVSCEERIGHAGADLRVFDRSSRTVVLSDTVNGMFSEARCNDSSDAASPDNVLLARALQNVERSILTTLAPSIELRPLDFKESDAAIASAEAISRFQQALSFGRAKRLDEACARFAELYDGEKESPALTYNAAFCDEARGDLISAATRYRRASDLTGRPDAQIDRHLSATERTIKEVGIVTVAALQPRAEPGKQDNYVPTGRRVALVVGNARYDKGALINPANDARLIEKSLRKLGFQVTRVEDINRARFRTVIDDFANKASGADVALFYYAGHAIQAEGENYLLPVDNKSIHSLDELREGSVPLGWMLARLDSGTPPRIKLLFLDACRDNPMPSESRSLAGGLAPLRTAPKGAMIVFATAPGKTAADGSGKNSVFTKNFAAVVGTPNLKIEDMLKQVRVGVLLDSKNRQEPSEVSSLTGDFYFRPKQ
ncbi:caspase family protein [Herminiimonas sp. CN]|uniref:caspase family protein n=1 Tax=Herminiimonas sp. CN TaxID=1349818 RepID=UPI000473FCD5|nr:caspase family protein [Herminiimonas sp. CN]